MRREDLDAAIVRVAPGDGWASANMLWRAVVAGLDPDTTEGYELPTVQLVAHRASQLARDGHLEQARYGDVWHYRTGR